MSIYFVGILTNTKSNRNNNAKKLASITADISYAIKNTGVLTQGTENIASGTDVTVNASSVTFGVGNTGTATNGQVRITAIEIVYEAVN